MVEFYKVGGCVRDNLLGRRSKDIDYSVEAESFDAMRQAIVDRGGRIFVETPKYLTIRAHVPNMGACDYVLCRKDGEYTDGRRPESVEIGTIYDDLARRDFTMNAIAELPGGGLYDPFGGVKDIADKKIKCVGKAEDRFSEDGLRLIRAIRFSIVLGFRMDSNIRRCLHNPKFTNILRKVAKERIKDELEKAMRYNTVDTMKTLLLYPHIMDIVFEGNKIWFKPTMENR